jgi:hypothetical protein
MGPGFIITELQLQSTSAQPAIVKFERGLNVITGPSNTGKTYIYQCINYMFGGSKPPKPITQAASYQSVTMKLLSNEGERFTLQSDLKGGDFLVYGDGMPGPVKLARKHNPESDVTVSAFLLQLNNLLGKKIRTNAKGKTRTISYRDIVRYLLVEEKRIITDESPIVSGQYTTPTEEKSAFKLILTGQDDRDIIESLSAGEIKYRKGKIEMLTELVSTNSKELNQLADSVEPEERIVRIDADIEGLKLQHDQLKDEFGALDLQRSGLATQLSTVTSQKIYNDEVLIRSTILKQQYSVDSQRLNSTIEASYLLQDNPTLEENCPVCATPLGVKNIEPELSAVINACQMEIRKLGSLIQEVNESEAILNQENAGFISRMEDFEKKLVEISEQIDDGVGIKMKAIFEEITNLNGVKANLNRALFLKETIKSFEDQKRMIQSSIPKKDKESRFEDLLTSNVYELSNRLKTVLEKCNYPDITDVAYSETAGDFVISGEARELAGKGFRAITYAAFMIALQELLFNKPYSIGPTVLDSPLVTYRKPIAEGEEIPVDLAMDFYRYLASNAKVDQVIILENEEPPAEIEPLINHIIFTRSSSGRYGFIPVSPN